MINEGNVHVCILGEALENESDYEEEESGDEDDDDENSDNDPDFDPKKAKGAQNPESKQQSSIQTESSLTIKTVKMPCESF